MMMDPVAVVPRSIGFDGQSYDPVPIYITNEQDPDAPDGHLPERKRAVEVRISFAFDDDDEQGRAIERDVEIWLTAEKAAELGRVLLDKADRCRRRGRRASGRVVPFPRATA